MSLTTVDRDLLHRCLQKQPGSWNDFVDRFLSLFYHGIHYTAHQRSARLYPEDVEDIAAEILLQIVADDYKVLKQFRGQSSLATYLTVIARRVAIHELNRRQSARDSIRRGDVSPRAPVESPNETAAALKGMESLDEVEALLRRLKGKERETVRLFYLESRSYEEISTELHIPVNTIGSILSRARKKLRTANVGQSGTELEHLKSLVEAEGNGK